MLKKDVLRSDKDFSTIFNKGKSNVSKNVVIFYKKNNLEYNRTAFIASKKVGNSVKRNRARRLMKEVYREYKDNIVAGYDIIFIARNNILTAKYKDLVRTTKNMLVKIKLFAGEVI